jgi:hypothetical protein
MCTKVEPLGAFNELIYLYKKKVTGYTERYIGSIIIYFYLDLVYDVVVFSHFDYFIYKLKNCMWLHFFIDDGLTIQNGLDIALGNKRTIGWL